MPLAEAARYIRRCGPGILRSRPVHRGQPLWAIGQSVKSVREPWGLVLILGPANYPLMLPGIQTLQALAAGNAVLLKPGALGTDAAQALHQILVDALLPASLLHVLDESIDTAKAAIDQGVDHIVVTGSTATGQAVLRQAAESLTPVTSELGGCDAAIICEDADVDLALKALAFSLQANSGATCIAPRRLFVHRSGLESIEQRLINIAQSIAPAPIDAQRAAVLRGQIDDALSQGARLICGERTIGAAMGPMLLADAKPSMLLMREDCFAPVLCISSFTDESQAARLVNSTPYGLGATIFASPRRAATLAARLRVGCVVINDIIAPTADPRVSFGGVGHSGHGVTRGPEGLLAMTRAKIIIARGGKFRPHLEAPDATTSQLLTGYLQFTHARTLSARFAGLRQMLGAMRRSTKQGRRT